MRNTIFSDILSIQHADADKFIIDSVTETLRRRVYTKSGRERVIDVELIYTGNMRIDTGELIPCTFKGNPEVISISQITKRADTGVFTLNGEIVISAPILETK